MTERLEYNGKIDSIQKRKAKNDKDFLKIVVMDFNGSQKTFNTFNMDFEGYSVGQFVKAIYEMQPNGFPKLLGFEDGVERPMLNTSNKTNTASYSNENQKVDWESINRGKVRSLFIQARIQKEGLKPLTEEEKKSLSELEDIAMNGLDKKEIEKEQAEI